MDAERDNLQLKVLGKIRRCRCGFVGSDSVMAGCEPKLRIVIAAVQAMLDPEINLHGLHAHYGATLDRKNGLTIKSAHLNYKHGVLEGSEQRATHVSDER